jgi:hypothetical protein
MKIAIQDVGSYNLQLDEMAHFHVLRVSEGRDTDKGEPSAILILESEDEDCFIRLEIFQHKGSLELKAKKFV